MGDVADDAFNAAMREEERQAELREFAEANCKAPADAGSRRCIFDVNDDGLLECKICGIVGDFF